MDRMTNWCICVCWFPLAQIFICGGGPIQPKSLLSKIVFTGQFIDMLVEML
jgi:hypothetical protein